MTTPTRFARTELLFGAPAMDALAQSHVAVFGIGGVGGYVVEALVRSGIGEITIVDNDTISESNINRQIIATESTIGRDKVEAMRDRILDINPNCNVHARKCFYLPATRNEFNFTEYNYIVDAVDTVTAKLQLIEEADRCSVPIISCMGAGNKLDPTRFRVADISKTSVCPLAKIIRKECRKRNIKNLKVVFSDEPALEVRFDDSDPNAERPPLGRRSLPGSNAFVPAAAGLTIAAAVIEDLIGNHHA